MSGFSKKVVFVLGDLGDLAGMVDEKLLKRDCVPEDDIVSVVSNRVGRERVKQSYCNERNWCSLDVLFEMVFEIKETNGATSNHPC